MHWLRKTISCLSILFQFTSENKEQKNLHLSSYLNNDLNLLAFLIATLHLSKPVINFAALCKHSIPHMPALQATSNIVLSYQKKCGSNICLNRSTTLSLPSKLNPYGNLIAWFVAPIVSKSFINFSNSSFDAIFGL